jgi:hypothetical protein
MQNPALLFVALAAASIATALPAQEAPLPKPTPPAEQASGLLSEAALDTLVAPVALYPDTLLIQILVASTYPLDVVKGDRLLQEHEGEEPQQVKALFESESFDPSIAVLGTAFPTVLTDMSDHIEWTESLGDAMAAQDQDVMDAVQRMRSQAIDTGALVSNDRQLVQTDDANDVIIQPADPQTVYVPQYDPKQVYDSSLSNALVGGAIGFGAFALMDSIFDDDDEWHDYWGCGHCGGWDGGPVINDPTVNIDRNIIAGNRGRLDDNDVRRELRQRRDEIGWKPDPEKRQEAADRIRQHDGDLSKLSLDKSASRGDELRSRLSERSGAPDISRDGAAIDKIKANAGDHPDLANRIDAAGGRPALAHAAEHRPASAVKKANIERPKQISRPANKPAISASSRAHAKSALSKHSNGHVAKKAKARGHASHARHRR